ncbi:MAG: nitroreductase [Anaerovoracaceae bacterium]|nr:nitroreductase [Bacillota bacterium]MEE0516387.1 nitroreductase [Anaerovoracaceae bacterium]
MNETLKTIFSRRSVRNFNDSPVKEEDLNLILKAAVYAPSGMNRQTWQFTAVTDRGKIQELALLIEKKLGREDYDFYKPAAIIISSNERDSRWGKEDNACAMENIFLAARSLGIGSVWTNQVRLVCDDEEVRQLIGSWGIPDSHVVYGTAAIGYTDSEPSLSDEKRGIIKIVK